jgi:hypothetical protein
VGEGSGESVVNISRLQPAHQPTHVPVVKWAQQLYFAGPGPGNTAITPARGALGINLYHKCSSWLVLRWYFLGLARTRPPFVTGEWPPSCAGTNELPHARRKIPLACTIFGALVVTLGL